MVFTLPKCNSITFKNYRVPEFAGSLLFPGWLQLRQAHHGHGHAGLDGPLEAAMAGQPVLAGHHVTQTRCGRLLLLN
ncbi:hypothetical protein MAR_000540, partial [Mya arenaria]